MLPRVTPLRHLLDLRLDGLDRFVCDRRAGGKSWRTISNEIRDSTGIDIAYETLRSWYADESDKASA